MSFAREEDISEVPDYPPEWTAEQRVAAYWHAVYHTGFPAYTKDWHTVWKLAQRENNRTAQQESRKIS